MPEKFRIQTDSWKVFQAGSRETGALMPLPISKGHGRPKFQESILSNRKNGPKNSEKWSRRAGFPTSFPHLK